MGYVGGARPAHRANATIAGCRGATLAARFHRRVPVNVVMKNVRDVLGHMTERGSGDSMVTSFLAAHYPTPWEPVYASFDL